MRASFQIVLLPRLRSRLRPRDVLRPSLRRQVVQGLSPPRLSGLPGGQTHFTSGAVSGSREPLLPVLPPLLRGRVSRGSLRRQAVPLSNRQEMPRLTENVRDQVQTGTTGRTPTQVRVGSVPHLRPMRGFGRAPMLHPTPRPRRPRRLAQDQTSPRRDRGMRAVVGEPDGDGYVEIEREPPLLVFADYEAITDAEGVQTAILIGYETTESDDTVLLYGQDCTTRFIEAMDELAVDGEGYDRHAIVLFHNLKGYGGIFLLQHLYRVHREVTDQITVGTKILCLTSDRLTFKDSLCFLPFPLSAFPATFSLTELHKGFFPHLFNTLDNQDYQGPMPDARFYDPDGMSAKKKADFERWYAEQVRDDVVLHLRRLVKQSVVRIKNRDARRRRVTSAPRHGALLRVGRQAAQGGLPNIPSGVRGQGRVQLLRQVRHHRLGLQPFLAEKTLARPHHRVRTLSRLEGSKVQSLRQSPAMVGVARASSSRRHAFHVDRDPPDRPHPTGPQRRRATPSGDVPRGRVPPAPHPLRVRLGLRGQDRHRAPNILGFPRLGGTLATSDHLFRRMHQRRPRLHHEADPARGEQINYLDVTSLYPWVNKKQTYPVGPPEILTDPGHTDIAQYFGLAQVDILPPFELYHPVPPYRHGGKLTFPLCAKCVETEMSKPLLEKSRTCTHPLDERILRGTWCTTELVNASEKGYTITKIHEVWTFPESQRRTGLFAEYVNTWLNIKQESAGYPSWAHTPDQKQQYVRGDHQCEGIDLDPQHIVKNAGQKATAKLMLNSFWGKFGENLCKPTTQVVTTPAHLLHLVSNPTYHSHTVRIRNPVTLEVVYLDPRDNKADNGHVSFFVAAFTTCHARLKLCDYLDHLKEQDLYFDTDSVIFSHLPGQLDILTGDFLGEMKDELEGDDYIVDFSSRAPRIMGPT